MRDFHPRALAALKELGPALVLEAIGLQMAGEDDEAGELAGKPPARIQIFREGSWVRGDGELVFTPADFDVMVKNQRAAAVDVVLDREHESWFGSLPGEPGARGWITSLEVGDDPKNKGKVALWGVVDWTPDGVEDWERKRFKYLSGGVYLKSKDRVTGKPIGAFLDHVALVTRPFIQGMEPLFNSLFGGVGRFSKETHMNQLYKTLAADLGLPETATEAEILARWEDKKKALAAPTPTPTDNAALARIAALEAQRETDRKSQVTRLVDDAVQAFKVTPAERDGLIAFGQKSADSGTELERQLKLRQPMSPNAALQFGQAGAGAAAAGASGAHGEVVAWLKNNPGKSPYDAVCALSATKPQAFAGCSIPGVF